MAEQGWQRGAGCAPRSWWGTNKTKISSQEPQQGRNWHLAPEWDAWSSPGTAGHRLCENLQFLAALALKAVEIWCCPCLLEGQRKLTAMIPGTCTVISQLHHFTEPVRADNLLGSPTRVVRRRQRASRPQLCRHPSALHLDSMQWSRPLPRWKREKKNECGCCGAGAANKCAEL